MSSGGQDLLHSNPPVGSWILFDDHFVDMQWAPVVRAPSASKHGVYCALQSPQARLKASVIQSSWANIDQYFVNVNEIREFCLMD